MHPTTGAAHDEDEDDGASIEVPTAAAAAITPRTGGRGAAPRPPAPLIARFTAKLECGGDEETKRRMSRRGDNTLE